MTIQIIISANILCGVLFCSVSISELKHSVPKNMFHFRSVSWIMTFSVAFTLLFYTLTLAVVFFCRKHSS
jgi:hypothetical protein